MKITESMSPIPAVKRAINRPMIKTRGKVRERVWPEIYTTAASGINPIRKLINAARAAAKANIFGGTETLVNTPPFAAMELAA